MARQDCRPPGKMKEKGYTYNNLDFEDDHQGYLPKPSIASADCPPPITFILRNIQLKKGACDRDDVAKSLEEVLGGKTITCEWCGHQEVTITLKEWTGDWKGIGQRLRSLTCGPDVHLEPQTNLVAVDWLSDSVTDEWLDLYFTNPKKTSISSEVHFYRLPGQKTALIEFVKATGFEIETLCNKSHTLANMDVIVTPWFGSKAEFIARDTLVDETGVKQPHCASSQDSTITPQPYYDSSLDPISKPQPQHDSCLDPTIKPQRSWQKEGKPTDIGDDISFKTVTNVTELLPGESKVSTLLPVIGGDSLNKPDVTDPPPPYSKEIIKEELPIYALIKKAKLPIGTATIDLDHGLWSATGSFFDIRRTKRIMKENVDHLTVVKQYKPISREVFSMIRQEGGEGRLEKILEEEDITATVRLSTLSIEIFVSTDDDVEREMAMSHIFERIIITEKIPWDRSFNISKIKDMLKTCPVVVGFSTLYEDTFLEIRGFRATVAQVQQSLASENPVNRYIYDRVTGAVLYEDPSYNKMSLQKSYVNSQTSREYPDVSKSEKRPANQTKSGVPDTDKTSFRQTDVSDEKELEKKSNGRSQISGGEVHRREGESDRLTGETPDATRRRAGGDVHRREGESDRLPRETPDETRRTVKADLSSVHVNPSMAWNTNSQLNLPPKKAEGSTNVDLKTGTTECNNPISRKPDNTEPRMNLNITTTYRSVIGGSFHLLTDTPVGQALLKRLEHENKCTITVKKCTLPGSVKDGVPDTETLGDAARSQHTVEPSTLTKAARAVKKRFSKKSKCTEVEYEMGGCKVILTDNDITKCMDDVLVNTVSMELSFKGKVAQEFINKAGRKLQAAVKFLSPVHVDDVVETASYWMSSQCQFIFHAVLPKPDDSHTRRIGMWKIIGTVLTKILNSVSGKRLQSLAMPAIGCGKLAVPPKHMAEQLLRRLSDQLRDKRNTIKVVRLCAMDVEIFTSIKQYFDEGDYGLVSRERPSAEHSVGPQYGAVRGGVSHRDGAICTISGHSMYKVLNCKESLKMFLLQKLEE